LLINLQFRRNIAMTSIHALSPALRILNDNGPAASTAPNIAHARASLATMPPELFLMIIERLDNVRDLRALISTSKLIAGRLGSDFDKATVYARLSNQLLSDIKEALDLPLPASGVYTFSGERLTADYMTQCLAQLTAAQVRAFEYNFWQFHLRREPLQLDVAEDAASKIARIVPNLWKWDTPFQYGAALHIAHALQDNTKIDTRERLAGFDNVLQQMHGGPLDVTLCEVMDNMGWREAKKNKALYGEYFEVARNLPPIGQAIAVMGLLTLTNHVSPIETVDDYGMPDAQGTLEHVQTLIQQQDLPPEQFAFITGLLGNSAQQQETGGRAHPDDRAKFIKDIVSDMCPGFVEALLRGATDSAAMTLQHETAARMLFSSLWWATVSAVPQPMHRFQLWGAITKLEIGELAPAELQALAPSLPLFSVDVLAEFLEEEASCETHEQSFAIYLEQHESCHVTRFIALRAAAHLLAYAPHAPNDATLEKRREFDQLRLKMFDSLVDSGLDSLEGPMLDAIAAQFHERPANFGSKVTAI
jgi:hypothetical protein